MVPNAAPFGGTSGPHACAASPYHLPPAAATPPPPPGGRLAATKAREGVSGRRLRGPGRLGWLRGPGWLGWLGWLQGLEVEPLVGGGELDALGGVG